MTRSIYSFNYCLVSTYNVVSHQTLFTSYIFGLQSDSEEVKDFSRSRILL